MPLTDQGSPFPWPVWLCQGDPRAVVQAKHKSFVVPKIAFVCLFLFVQTWDCEAIHPEILH